MKKFKLLVLIAIVTGGAFFLEAFGLGIILTDLSKRNDNFIAVTKSPTKRIVYIKNR